MEYLLVKWVHIISSTILFGTGIGSAFYMFMANRHGQVSDVYFAPRHVVFADWVFTSPAVVIQLVTGLWLVELAGYEYSDSWVVWALILYFFIGICWLPVVWIQLKMRDYARDANQGNTCLPKAYWKLDKWWIILGSIAFPAVVIIFYLMVFKPDQFL